MAEHDDKREVSRRTFLFELAAMGVSTSVLASCARAAGGAASPGANAGVRAGAGATANMIGLQMYTVRDQLQADFGRTVESIAKVGYKNLEFAGYYNRPPEEVRALLDRVGVVSRSAHVGAPLMRQDAAAQIRSAKTIGQEYITLPSYNFGKEGLAGWRKGVAEFNQWGAMCRDAGIKLAYHNHAAEFAPLEGTTGYDVLLGEVDPQLVDFELDIYWARFADQDPLALFSKYPGRFTMWHVKDMSVTGTQKGMTPVGKGTIDYKTIFANARASGMKYFFVEHDTAGQYPGGSLASVQASYEYLRTLLA
ncbi:MAG TPA: sugar phosphate isomerase/epimerase [Gemmatimonadaceae bacterium]|nr:sugar phosphate isomerase/epimerase [Gemmatimonadaceae bacterium]